jgi:hypothetical protein
MTKKDEVKVENLKEPVSRVAPSVVAPVAAPVATKPKTVKMVRYDEVVDGPRTADVHPDEVDNWLKAGWHKE